MTTGSVFSAGSIFTIAGLDQNYMAEVFDRIYKGEATEIGNDMGRVSEIPENFFIALASAIELARKGEVYDIVHKSDQEKYINQTMTRKLSLFREGALMSVTLTKKTGQLRGWIVGPRLSFWKDGTHVDGYGSNGIFEVHGDIARLKELTEKHLTQGMRRFEDDMFIVWI